MKSLHCIVLLFLLSVWAFASVPQYTITDLDGRSDYYLCSSAADINNDCHVVGEFYIDWWRIAGISDYKSHAFLWQDGQMTDLGTAEDMTYCGASAINDLGQIIGLAYVYHGHSSSSIPMSWHDSAFIWGYFHGDEAIPMDINEKGQIVGGVSDWLDSSFAFIMDNSVMYRMGYGTDPWDEMSWCAEGYDAATSINDLRVIVGWSKDCHYRYHAFMWKPFESITDLGVPVTDTWWPWLKINNRSIVAGTYGVHPYARTTRAFTWRDGAVSDLPGLGGQSSIARDINEGGQIVGSAQRADGSYTPVMWQDSKVTDLFPLISGSSKWDYITPQAINDRGYIVGQGGLFPRDWREKRYHAILLTPIIQVEVDILPNQIKLGSNAALPVAILGSTDFDPSQVDPATVTLAGALVAVNAKGKYKSSLGDVNGDGRPDLVLHFITAQLSLQPGDTSVLLEGKTRDGIPIAGEDTISVN